MPHNAKHKEVFKEQLETISKNDQFFFLNYMFFTYTTYILARDVVHSVNLSLYLILNQFICTLKEFGKAFKVFSIDLDQSQLKSIVDLRDQLDEIIINKFDNINETISKYESHLADFQKKITNDTKISAKSIHEHLQNANLILQKSLDSTVQLENSGSEVGEVIFTNLALKIIEDKFSSIKGQDVSSKKLAEVRKELNIMNPLSEDSWDETLKDIFEEIELGNENLSQCIRILQGFDLSRQILEHRLTEHTLINNYKMDRHINDLNHLKNSLGDVICAKLVTEQEKFSLNYFLPEVYRIKYKVRKSKLEQSESLNPGNLAMF